MQLIGSEQLGDVMPSPFPVASYGPDLQTLDGPRFWPVHQGNEVVLLWIKMNSTSVHMWCDNILRMGRTLRPTRKGGRVFNCSCSTNWHSSHYLHRLTCQNDLFSISLYLASIMGHLIEADKRKQNPSQSPVEWIWVETGPGSSHHSVLQKQFPPVWRWRRGCWNSHWIFSAYPGLHEGIIPKAFQELDLGFMHSQLMLALPVRICPNRTEAGHELSFILAIVWCFWLLIPCLRNHTQMRVAHSLQATRSVKEHTVHVRRCSHKHARRAA